MIRNNSLTMREFQQIKVKNQEDLRKSGQAAGRPGRKRLTESCLCLQSREVRLKCTIPENEFQPG